MYSPRSSFDFGRPLRGASRTSSDESLVRYGSRFFGSTSPSTKPSYRLRSPSPMRSSLTGGYGFNTYSTGTDRRKRPLLGGRTSSEMISNTVTYGMKVDEVNQLEKDIRAAEQELEDKKRKLKYRRESLDIAAKKCDEDDRFKAEKQAAARLEAEAEERRYRSARYSSYRY